MARAETLLLIFLTQWTVQLLSSKADSHSAGHFSSLFRRPQISVTYSQGYANRNTYQAKRNHTILLWFHKLHITLNDLRLRPWCDVFVLLGCYAALIGICLQMFQDSLSWPVKLWPIGCFETSVTNYQSNLYPLHMFWEKVYWASEIEWLVVRHSRDKISKGMFWKGETLRVAGSQKGLAVVAVPQCHNKWV
jgi:hypothetical protein